eukprot:scaffold1992_cov113-Cylindrotheca_fusiformis.AAC.5
MPSQSIISCGKKFSGLTSRKLFVMSTGLLYCLLQTSIAFQCPSSPVHLSSFQRSPISDFKVTQSKMHSSTWKNDDIEDGSEDWKESSPHKESDSFSNDFLDGFPLGMFRREKYNKLPPLQVEDFNLLFYDIFLIVNLSLSISFWVTHRLSFAYLPAALNEGCIFSAFWILSGLYHGSFLMSAVDGHYGSTDERAGPKAAAALSLNTFFSAINMRLLFALGSAIVHHRQVGTSPVEELLPLEIGCGIVLMTFWRTLHSYVTPRI